MKVLKIWWHGTKIKIPEPEKLDQEFIEWLVKVSEGEGENLGNGD